MHTHPLTHTRTLFINYSTILIYNVDMRFITVASTLVILSALCAGLPIAPRGQSSIDQQRDSNTKDTTVINMSCDGHVAEASGTRGATPSHRPHGVVVDGPAAFFGGNYR